MECICQVSAGIRRYIADVFCLSHAHVLQCRDNLFAGESVPELLFQDPIDKKCDEAGHKMGFYPVVPAQIGWAGTEVIFHDPE